MTGFDDAWATLTASGESLFCTQTAALIPVGVLNNVQETGSLHHGTKATFHIGDLIAPGLPPITGGGVKPIASSQTGCSSSKPNMRPDRQTSSTYRRWPISSATQCHPRIDLFDRVSTPHNAAPEPCRSPGPA